MLNNDQLRQLEKYVLEHLDQPLDVAVLARLAGLSEAHFSRVFTQAVGLSPHRFVVHLRLQRALELVRTNGLRLADIAVMTGFADQSHLARWVRRVHGVTLSALKCGKPLSHEDPGLTTGQLPSQYTPQSLQTH